MNVKWYFQRKKAKKKLKKVKQKLKKITQLDLKKHLNYIKNRL